MAQSQLFVIAAPRSGAGLFHESVISSKEFSNSELSTTSLIDIALSELGITPGNTHAISELGLSDAQRDLLKTKIESLAAEVSGNLVDYHPGFTLNVDFLAEVFPEAKFVFVSRAFNEAIASGIEAWQSAAFVTEPDLPNWWGTKWSFPLIPSWMSLIGEPINEIVARQFVELSNVALDSLNSLDRSRVGAIRFEDLLADPNGSIEKTLATLGIEWVGGLDRELPSSKASSAPGLNRELSGLAELAKTGVQINQEAFSLLLSNLNQLGIETDLYELPSSGGQSLSSATAGNSPKVKKQLSEGTAFVAHFTGALPELLTKARASIVFSAYNSGLVGTVRAEGNSIDTSYIRLPKPMGMALSNGKLAISTLDTISSFQQHNQLAGYAAEGLTPDAVFVPQNIVYTGHLAVHDMAYGTAPGYEGLWFINSAFSCLSVMDPNFSFVPKWRPSWISGLAFENRCHLNGLAMVDGAPRYVTSLSQADTPQGWRQDKGTTGLIVDITSNKVVASGLSMPHSPRWHKNKLYFLESGKGSLASVDHKTGEITTIATLPGFTRGLSFIGDYALVGLSQVRETAFKDLPVTSTKQERNCGIWVVDTRSGKTVATLKFDGVIQELFEVTVVENSSWPVFVDRIPQTASAFVLPNVAIKQLVKHKPNNQSAS
jgi:uncharacterized protein (TIGR03032 family)